MTEFIDKFARAYDNLFMSVPTYKTVIYVVTLTCCVLINNKVLQLRHSSSWYYVMVVLTLYLLFIPMMHDSALKVWLYYLPSQLFTFALSAVGMHIMKKNPEQYSNNAFHHYRKLLLWTLVFSVLIVIEDTYVIFNIDIYSDILVRINNRSITEDIMSIFYSVYALLFMIRELSIPMKNTTEDTVSQMPIPTAHLTNESLSEFYLFCKKYQLTSREQDVFKLLLENKNNQIISDQLTISLGTTKSHVHNIFMKVEVNNRRELIDIYENWKAE
jgi:DNA-binding CsgD family transcriptional regulator